ncbi:hypothetical protein Clacol_009500 [Clathrus columnatus]|uniref:Methyltransferase domain-containing protein n=1 Tax=Clathrus columnatus TaxID=1419009 RepID=A0AAV5AKS6_9AGAM|nr:hypothetical protein Clacol_009500 [Clathrus columnatus]
MFKSHLSIYVSQIFDIFSSLRPKRPSVVKDISRPKTLYLQSVLVLRFNQKSRFMSFAGTEPEYKRLDDIHNAIRGVQNGAVSFTELENPKYILDMGCGSAAWSIQAAETYPNAKVLAADIISKPNRYFPENIRYKQVDLCKPFPSEFKPASFDTIHARLLFIHLPNYKDIIEKTITLLKPGGWLLITDVVVVPYGIRNPIPTRLYRFFKGRADWIASTGGSPNIGQELANVLGSFPQLVEVNVKKIAIPISRWQDESLDPALRELAAAMRRSLLFGINTPQFGMSEEQSRQSCLETIPISLNTVQELKVTNRSREML